MAVALDQPLVVVTRLCHGHERRPDVILDLARLCLHLVRCGQNVIVTRKGTPLTAAGLSPGNVHRHDRVEVQAGHLVRLEGDPMSRFQFIE